MEVAEGVSLRELLDGKPLDLERARRIATEMAEGLAAAHAAGVVHRDLKPDNVMIASDGVKLVDFGLAKRAKAPMDDREVTGELTEEGVVLGTPAYMSPEQARGQEAGPASDVFAFGATLFEMVTGRRAFSGSSTADVLAAILRDEAPRADAVESSVPADMAALIRRCLRKESEQRPADGAELLAAIRALPEGVAPRRRGATWAVLAVAASAIAIAVAIAWPAQPASLRPALSDAVAALSSRLTPPQRPAAVARSSAPEASAKPIRPRDERRASPTSSTRPTGIHDPIYDKRH